MWEDADVGYVSSHPLISPQSANDIVTETIAALHHLKVCNAGWTSPVAGVIMTIVFCCLDIVRSQAGPLLLPA